MLKINYIRMQSENRQLNMSFPSKEERRSSMFVLNNPPPGQEVTMSNEAGPLIRCNAMCYFDPEEPEEAGLSNDMVEFAEELERGLVEAAKKQRRVWFPEDENGNYHSLNPDDGCGGGLYKLETIHPIYYTSDGLPPKDDMSNVLEGEAARKQAKTEAIGKNWAETIVLVYRTFDEPINAGGCGRQWRNLERILLELEEPLWCEVGLLWRRLYGKSPRPEEFKSSGYGKAW